MAKYLMTMCLDRRLSSADEECKEALQRIKAGTDVWCDLRVARNPRTHKLYMGLIGLVYPNLPDHRAKLYPNIWLFRKAVEMEAGWREELITVHGEVIYIPKSVAFSECDDIEFNALWPKVIGICADMLRMDSSDLANELERYAA